MKIFFQQDRANRLDIHWNSELHIKQTAEGTAPEEVKEPEAAAAAEAEVAEPEVQPTYETEKRHESIAAFKQSMGLFTDNYKLNYASTYFKL